MVAVSLYRSARVTTRRLPTTSKLDVKSSIPISRAEVAQVVEQRTENPRVSGSTPLLGTTHEARHRNDIGSRLPLWKGRPLGRRLTFRGSVRRSGGKVDATVSKTVGGQPPCRFESDLRHQKVMQCRVV